METKFLVLVDEELCSIFCVHSAISLTIHMKEERVFEEKDSHWLYNKKNNTERF